jgi:hypothetical protein
MTDENAQTEVTELEVEDEQENEAYVEFDIISYPSDLTIESLVQMLDAGEILIPPYQRRYVWSIQQASILVESFLIGLPVPPIFLYQNEEQKFEVVDGQQRIQSLANFLRGTFAEGGTQGKTRQFRLTGLSDESPYARKLFSELDERDQRKLRFSILRSINIRQNSPQGDINCVYYIFERLNTGGTALRPQEIRNVIARGQIVSELFQLNMNPRWRHILDSQPDKFQRDVELVLRFLALFRDWPRYRKPMKSFLTSNMKDEKTASSKKFLVFKCIWPRALALIERDLGARPFRPKRVINAAILEAIVVATLEILDRGSEPNLSRYQALLADQNFQKMITGATTDTDNVKERIRLALQYLGQYTNNDP